jgi:hypothetical protein
MLNLGGIVAAILKMVTGRNFSMSGINSGHHNLATYEMALKSDNVEFVRYCGGHFDSKISAGRHFQNGHHNTAKIQHCPISSKFDMWVDNDVPTLKIFYRSPFSKWPPQYRTNSTLSDFNANVGTSLSTHISNFDDIGQC